MTDICCIGHITRDKIITPESTVYMAGGTSFYMSYGMSRLPKTVSYKLVTKVGKGQFPEVEKLRQAGIDVRCYDSRHTVYFENKYGANSDNRTQRVLAKADPFTLEEMKPLEAKVFHLGSLLADDFSPEVVEYLSTKGQVSIDVQGYLREVSGEQVRAVDWKDKERILACTDILKLNEHEMEVITHSRNPRTVALQLADMGVKEVIITLGSYGSLIYCEGRFYEVPAYKPQVLVDATGCGDTYSTGYLWMRLQGASCEEAGRFAAAMCTLKLEHSGPFDKTLADIHRVMRRK
ncbi:PfkB family carbohydrate kinase [Hallella mizrahii]|jgi:sugar/nucleoside kinase (ribokinase family)|uniref:Ribokinase n=1 Tax=Hallella mizrahii TaxID=2606637 RepID=A0A7K0KCH6_9BACT|nr:PfkB family carbohydrate kinase [Hallella mizrahii]MST83579.1 ribokinase [Hallella mizrahii]